MMTSTSAISFSDPSLTNPGYTVGQTVVQVFTNTAVTATFIVPCGVTRLDYIMIGGGGGGGGGSNRSPGGGGGAGQLVQGNIIVASGAKVSITVGQGGPGGAANNYYCTGNNTYCNNRIIICTYYSSNYGGFYYRQYCSRLSGYYGNYYKLVNPNLKQYGGGDTTITVECSYTNILKDGVRGTFRTVTALGGGQGIRGCGGKVGSTIGGVRTWVCTAAGAGGRSFEAVYREDLPCDRMQISKYGQLAQYTYGSYTRAYAASVYNTGSCSLYSINYGVWPWYWCTYRGSYGAMGKPYLRYTSTSPYYNFGGGGAGVFSPGGAAECFYSFSPGSLPNTTIATPRDTCAAAYAKRFEANWRSKKLRLSAGFETVCRHPSISGTTGNYYTTSPSGRVIPYIGGAGIGGSAQVDQQTWVTTSSKKYPNTWWCLYNTKCSVRIQGSFDSTILKCNQTFVYDLEGWGHGGRGGNYNYTTGTYVKNVSTDLATGPGSGGQGGKSDIYPSQQYVSGGPTYFCYTIYEYVTPPSYYMTNYGKGYAGSTGTAGAVIIYYRQEFNSSAAREILQARPCLTKFPCLPDLPPTTNRKVTYSSGQTTGIGFGGNAMASMVISFTSNVQTVKLSRPNPNFLPALVGAVPEACNPQYYCRVLLY
jgi:hypothetical protein